MKDRFAVICDKGSLHLFETHAAAEKAAEALRLHTGGAVVIDLEALAFAIDRTKRRGNLREWLPQEL